MNQSITVPTDRKAYLLNLAQQEDRRWQASWTALSGTDMAEGELYRYTRDFYRAVAEGSAVEDVIALCDKGWRAYAEQNNHKVNAAPKTQRGPMSGHSSRSHRWVSPDKFQAKAIHLRMMVKIAAEQGSRS